MNNLTIARRLASQMWGKPDHQHRLVDGIWKFSTPSHGGIIVDIEVRPLLREYRTEVTRYKNHAMNHEQHFAAFEEDCDAAIVEWIYGNEFHNKRFRSRYRSNPELSDKEFFEKRLQIIKEILKRWHPEVLEKWPEPYVDKDQKHGVWLNKTEFNCSRWTAWTVCSVCNGLAEEDDDLIGPLPFMGELPAECPHCGAIMIGKEKTR